FSFTATDSVCLCRHGRGLTDFSERTESRLAKSPGCAPKPSRWCSTMTAAAWRESVSRAASPAETSPRCETPTFPTCCLELAQLTRKARLCSRPISIGASLGGAIAVREARRERAHSSRATAVAAWTARRPITCSALSLVRAKQTFVLLIEG